MGGIRLFRLTHRMLLCCAAAALVGGCAGPPSSPAAPDGAAPRSSQASGKTLRIALQGAHEPTQGIISFGSPGGFTTLEHFLIFHSSLQVYDEGGNLESRLALKNPTLYDDDWKTFPDGRMQVTWKLRDTQWHDGAPLTAADFAFGLQVHNDPQVPVPKPEWGPLISGIETPDPRTLVVKWSSLSFQGGGTGTGFINPVPAHLLARSYEAGDFEAFLNNPLWLDDFVGLGPYRLTRWQRGSFIEGIAHPGYVLGSPRIRRVLISYVGDVNAMVARILAGDQDLIPMGGRVDGGQMAAVRRAWGPGVGYTEAASNSTRAVYWQLRDPRLPFAADVRVRRGLAHATDREALAEAMNEGLTPGAHTFIPPNDAAYPVLERRGFARYPYEPARALQLFTEAGWTPDAGGKPRSQAGELLRADLSATAQGSNIEEITALSSMWQRIGVDSDIVPNTARGDQFDEQRANFRGGFVWPGIGFANPTALLSWRIPTEQNRWKGNNFGGYSNPAYDSLYERYIATLENEAQLQVLAEMMALAADQVPVMPTFYYGNVVIAREGLVGPKIFARQSATAGDIHTWDLR